MIKFTDSHYLIHYWMGTDTLKLITFPPTNRRTWYIRIVLERIIWKTIEPLFREHWVAHENLIDNLVKFGIDRKKISVHYVPIWQDVSIIRKPHKEFNILYYRSIEPRNQIFKDWLYGYDYFERLKVTFAHSINIEYIEINQSHTKDEILNILEITDIYVRPNRHDGGSRLSMLCSSMGIPVYNTRTETKYLHLALWVSIEYEKYLMEVKHE